MRSWDGLGTLIAAREITGPSPHIRLGVRYPALGAEPVRRLAHLVDGDTAGTWASPTLGEAPDGE
ncbi:hypothetical protein [Embleya sp. NPDC001921]